MKGQITVGIFLLSMLLALAACSGSPAPAASAAVELTPASQSSSEAVNLMPVSQQGPAVSASPVSSTTPQPSGPIKVTELAPTVSGDTVTIPVSAVQKDWNVHFYVDTPQGRQGFMAYNLDNQIYVRASICPPCRGKTYSLDGSTLVCDTCATTFSAKTGIGIAGACVNYPKASVAYQVSGGNIVMNMNDLTTAYQNTLKPGLP